MRPVHLSPSRAPIAIGAKLRAARTAQSLTIDNVSEATGLTKSFISRVERDESSPSVASLVLICEVLSLRIDTLFAPPEREVITLEDAPRINMGGTDAIEKLLTPRKEARVQMLRSSLNPGATGGEELRTMNCDVEVVHILSGEMTVRFADEEMALTAGDTITIEGREPYTWTCTSAGVSDVLWALVPAAWSGSS